MTIVEMRVHMDCPGCERKIMKALSKLDGIDNIDIDMDKQKVTVTGWADQEKVLKTVKKTGRQAELWPYPYNPEYHDYTYHYYGTSTDNYNHFYSEQNSGYNYNSPASYFMAEPPSTYNYNKQGYNGHEHGYYQQPPSSTIFNEGTTTIFSDDNATGCSIM